jgi:hypothetical protein
VAKFMDKESMFIEPFPNVMAVAPLPIGFMTAQDTVLVAVIKGRWGRVKKTALIIPELIPLLGKLAPLQLIFHELPGLEIVAYVLVVPSNRGLVGDRPHAEFPRENPGVGLGEIK